MSKQQVSYKELVCKQHPNAVCIKTENGFAVYTGKKKLGGGFSAPLAWKIALRNLILQA